MGFTGHPISQPVKRKNEAMAPLKVLERVAEGEAVGEELAATVLGELPDILGKMEPPKPAKDPEREYWYYSVPAAGVRYYGSVGRPSPGKGG